MKRPIVQAVILVLAAFVLAVAANAVASRQRKVTWVGWYPNATKVAARSESSQLSARSSQPVPEPAATSTLTPAPAPAAPIVTVTTASAAPIPPPAPQPPNVGGASARPDGLKPVLHTSPPATTTTAKPEPDTLARFTQP